MNDTFIISAEGRALLVVTGGKGDAGTKLGELGDAHGRLTLKKWGEEGNRRKSKAVAR